MRRYYRIDVHGRYGYSLAVVTELDDPDEIIDCARGHGLFDLPWDADYASVEDITDDDYEMANWANQVEEL